MFEEIKEYCSRFGENIGVVIENLITGEKMEVNSDMAFSSASLIKYPVMWCFFQQVSKGNISLKETYILHDCDKVGTSVFDTGVLRELHDGVELTLEDCVRFMIVISDDTATNIIMKKLGCENMNQVFREIGLTTTRIGRLMMDYKGLEQGRDNFVSAGDMNKLSNIICKNQILEEHYNEMMLNIMLAQRENDGINKTYPMNFPYAHKCGCIRQYEIDHESGILFKNGKPAITVNVCTRHVPDSRAVLQEIGKQLWKASEQT